MSSFTIYPAIDLRRGQVVRLSQGDPARQTVYGDDPAATAAAWKSMGTEWLHVVNLDGAFGEDTSANEAALKAILAVGVRIQFGGGLRSPETIEHALAAGIHRVVIGTAAVEKPDLLPWAVSRFGNESVALGLDARDGLVQLRGWAEGSALRAEDLGRRAFADGVRWCVFTDIARDGVSTGVNVEATSNLARATGLQVIASGGVAGPEDVDKVRAAGLPGVIIGRALYEGKIDLQAVLQSG